MNIEQNLDQVIEQIRRDAAEQCVDFDESANRFTVWAGGFFDRKQYCGGRQDLDAASRLATWHRGFERTLYRLCPADGF